MLFWKLQGSEGLAGTSTHHSKVSLSRDQAGWKGRPCVAAAVKARRRTSVTRVARDLMTTSVHGKA